MNNTTFEDRLEKVAQILESNSEKLMKSIVAILKYVFIAIMLVYLFDCFYSLLYKVVVLTRFSGGLNFEHIKELLVDALFVLIVLAVVRAQFLRSSFDYAIAFLEIGFVVVMRKLIFLEVTPENTMLIFALGIILSLFFVLILYVYKTFKAPMPQE